MAYTFTGYIFLYGNSYLRVLTDNDYTIACIIRLYRHFFGSFKFHHSKILYQKFLTHNNGHFLSFFYQVYMYIAGGALVGPGALKPSFGDGI